LLIIVVPLTEFARTDALSALAITVPMGILGLRALSLFPYDSETLDRHTEVMRLEEDKAYVAQYWNNTRNRRSLCRFLAAFDAAQAALRSKIVSHLGPFGKAMPLHQQLSYAVEAEIWTTEDADLWMKSLLIQQEVLISQHSQVGSTGLTELSERLTALAGRTATAALR
jgi:hypothetical protein